MQLQQRLVGVLAAAGELGVRPACTHAGAHAWQAQRGGPAACHNLGAASRELTPNHGTHFRTTQPTASAAQDEAAREEAEGAVSELRAAPKPLEVLYNDFAIPSQASATPGRYPPESDPGTDGNS